MRRGFEGVIDRKDMIQDILSMWVDSRLLEKTGVSLKFCYALSKLENGAEKHYHMRKECQCAFFNTIEIGIKERRKKFF